MTEEVIFRSVTGRVQRRKAHPRGFVASKRAAFLDALALTCNVKRSASVAGIDQGTAFRHRARDPVFAAQWREALNMGAERLEALLLEHGGAGVSLDPDPGRAETAGVAPEPFDFERALRALTIYRRIVDRPATGVRGTVLKIANREETNAALLKLIEGVKRARRRVGSATGASERNRDDAE